MQRNTTRYLVIISICGGRGLFGLVWCLVWSLMGRVQRNVPKKLLLWRGLCIILASQSRRVNCCCQVARPNANCWTAKSWPDLDVRTGFQIAHSVQWNRTGQVSTIATPPLASVLHCPVMLNCSCVRATEEKRITPTFLFLGWKEGEKASLDHYSLDSNDEVDNTW
jgi:hypothetical protein